MQRIAFPTLVTTFLAFGPAFAGPLNLNPQARRAATSAPSGIGSIFAAPPAAEPAPRMSYAATEPSFGGGFIEMLFRGRAAATGAAVPAGAAAGQIPLYAPRRTATIRTVDDPQRAAESIRASCVRK